MSHQPGNPDLSEGSIRELLERGTLIGSTRVSTDVRVSSEVPDALPGPFRKAAVLMALTSISGKWHLVLTRRTETVQHHKGQVAFPGGAWEPADSSLEQTALREAYEEIGLAPEAVRVLGVLDQMLTISSYLVTPVVGSIPWPYMFTLSVDEVVRVFTIPLDWLADPVNWEERPYFNPQRSATAMVIYFKPYDGEILWGASARLTVTLLKVLGLVDQ
jgi:8-oxo-dGTP pyrophosphatase MutT (NUDIX family)